MATSLDQMAARKGTCMVKRIEELHARRLELRSKIGELITKRERVGDQLLGQNGRDVARSARA
jgi:hypothetical protein